MAAENLVVGYGNPTRCDDGIGWAAVEALKGVLNGKADFLTEHQLLPELALELEGYQKVVFIDASVGKEPGAISFSEIEVGQPAHKTITHHVHPQDLLALASLYFNTHPEACLITVAGRVFEFGEELSDEVRAALPGVAEKVIAFIEN